MVKSFEHLSDAQVEHYGTNNTRERSGDAQMIEAHLENCPDCRARLLEYQRTNFGLLRDAAMQASPTASSSSEGGSGSGGHHGFASVAAGVCPSPQGASEDDLRNLAAGLLSPDKALTITQHAAQCPHCGPLLRRFTEDFSDDLSAEGLTAENEALSQLRSSTPKWQKEMAAQAVNPNRDRSSIRAVVSKPPRWSMRFSMRWALVPVSLAACALIAFAVWYSQRETPEKVEKLLAQAYTEHRTMEYRWPGAEWGPVRVTRGKGNASSSRPLALLDSEEVISRHANEEAGSAWNPVRAQAEILEHDPDSAIRHIQGTELRGQQSVDLLVKLAIAYSLKAEREDATQNNAFALDLLNKALQIDPANRAALYNRAIVKERMGLAHQSEVDWTRLLSEEKDQRWADESRKRLAELHSSKPDR